MRIVSLIASATEIVHALGLTPFQVGRSHECDYPDDIRRLPVCTAPAIAVDGSSAEIDRLVRERVRNALSVYDVFTDVLDELAPTHVITQTHCRVCAVSLEDVERALQESIISRPKLVSLAPDSLDDIWADIRRVADACDVRERGEQVVSDLQGRMQRVRDRALRSAARPRIACIEWIEPLMTAGNWMPELIEMANGVPLFGTAGRRSPELSWSDFIAADPDMVIVSPCGFDLARTREEMRSLAKRPEWRRLRAVEGGSVFLVDGNQYMNRPGPRVMDSLEIMAEILHPDLFAPEFEGRAWERWRSTAP